MAGVNGGLCPNCFRTSLSGGKCVQCGYVVTGSRDSGLVIPPGKILNGQYMIGRVLGIGGFGITYLAMHAPSNRLCAIKEYFPTSIAIRNSDASVSAGSNHDTFLFGLKAFFSEAETLKAFLGKPYIVQILSSFQENGTAYYAMEYLDGMNAGVLTKNLGGRLPYAFSIEILQWISGALQQVHRQGFLHRDVSPENIYITKTGQVKLIDFGATRFFIGERSMSLSVVLKPGFAPPEQYSSKGNQGPWTDIYALASTFYFFSSGIVIPDALDRLGGARIAQLKDIVPGLSSAISEIIDIALRLDYKQRFQTIDNFLSVVQTEVSAAAHRNPRPQSQPPRPQPQPPRPQPQPPRPQPQPQPPRPQPQPQPPRPQPQPPRPQPQPPRPQPRPQPQQPQQPRSSSPYLTVLSGRYKGNKWTIQGNTDIIIGRSVRDCSIVLDDVNISRVHCIIRYDKSKNSFYIMDSSTNGTYGENGQRFATGTVYNIAPNSKFYLATNDFMFMVGLI